MGTTTATPTGPAPSKGCMDIFAEAGKLIGDKPGNQRTVLKGVAGIIDGVGLLFTHSEKTLAVLKTAKTGDKTIKVLKGVGKVHDWYHYHWKDLLTFLRDVADTIVVSMALPQLLDSIKVISFASIGESLGQVPVLGKITIIPFGAFIAGLELFVSSIFMYQSAKKVYHAWGESSVGVALNPPAAPDVQKTWSRDATKLYKWKQIKAQYTANPNEVRGTLLEKMGNKHSTLFKTIVVEHGVAPVGANPAETESLRAVWIRNDNDVRNDRGTFFKKLHRNQDDKAINSFIDKEIDKWQKKVTHKNDIIHMETVNFIFHAVIATLSILTILSAFAITFVGIGLLMTLLGIAAAGIGVYVLIHDILNPKDQWAKALQITDLT